MSEQSHLQKVFEGILSSQSYELLQKFSGDETWETLRPEEKEQLAQLFLLSADVSAGVGNPEGRQQAITSFRSACRLTPSSARAWFRLGSFLALGDSLNEVQEAVDALQKAVELDGGFFDAHYALASAVLRLGVFKKDTALLMRSDQSFSEAASLVQHESGGVLVSAEFYWHWGIVWFLISKDSGEPIDVRSAIDRYEQARQKGLAIPDFYNDYANAITELALMTSNDAMIHEAISLYTVAIETGHSRERAVRLFNLGCCLQHLFEVEFDRVFFERALTAFNEVVELTPDMGAVWQRLAHLLFRGARRWHDSSLAEEAILKFYEAELRGVESSVTWALCSQAMLWAFREDEQLSFLNAAEEYAKRAVSTVAKDGHVHPEAWVALALCQFEYGNYFNDSSFLNKALQIIQDGLTEHPKNAVLWHVLALIKVASADAYDSQEMLKEALVCFLLASRSSYTNIPSFWHDWGWSLHFYAEWNEDLASAKEAVSTYERALELCHNKPLHWLYDMARAYDLVGDLSDEEEGYERAIQILNEILATDANFTPALYHLALSHLHLGELSEDVETLSTALSLFEQYFDQDPEDDIAWGDYGLTFVHRGSLERSEEGLPNDWFLAEEAFLKAISLGDSHALYHLGCLYSLMGNFSEAIRFLQQALEQEALPSLNEIQEDEWLDPLRLTAAFQSFLSRAAEQEELPPSS